MKKHWLLGAAALMLASSVVAQSSNNQDEVVKIERHAAREYREGEMIVKFKPESEVRVRAYGRGISSGVSGVDQVLGELGITASEQLMPLSGAVVIPRARALRSVSGNTIEDSDMSQLYRLSFDASNVNVHEAIDKLSALDEVEFAEPNYVVYALSSGEVAAADKGDDPLKGEQWGHGQLKLDFLKKQKPITDKRPVIAILDTGVDITHPDLADNIWTNEAEANGAEGEDDDANGFKDDLHGWDFVNQTSRLGDWNGHGTHCAGIAAAVGDNKIGITGANPDALIMPITVMQSDGTGDVATIIKGIDYAAANGADVISMSIGGYGYSLAEEQALAKAYNKAMLVAAAGNDCLPINPDCKCSECGQWGAPMFPAAFTFVLGVEASTKDGSRASFSNYDDDGPVFSKFSEDQLYNYELRAPGAQIMSTFPGGKYKVLSGTSMACPYVAGGISRLLQVKEYGNWEILFGDLIHARKHRCEHEHDENVDFEAVYKITDKDRTPTLSLVTYTLNDAEGGDGDSRPDAGETIEFYPTLRNEWGQAENIRFSLELTETEDPTIVEFLDDNVVFGKPLSSYGKNVSANPIRFKVNPKCVDGRKICMVLRATCDNIAEELEQEFTLTAENGVEIGGLILEDMTLYPDVHYIVTKPLLVPKDLTLTIEPGTILRFKDGSGINCEGKFIANGTPDSMIIFESAELLAEYSMKGIICEEGELSYVLFRNLNVDNGIVENYNNQVNNVIFEYCKARISAWSPYRSVLKYNELQYLCSNKLYMHGISESCNIINNKTVNSVIDIVSMRNCNVFYNFSNKVSYYGFPYSVSYETSGIELYKSVYPSYLGSSKESVLRKNVLDFNNPTNPIGYGTVDLDYVLKEPSHETHGIVWKVVVNGYDAQDEFEQLPPLGVGKHKFEVYFNRPMDKSFTPMIAMGVRPPYTSHSIAEEGSWNKEGTIYTAYLTIDGKTGADGLNRIYVSDAVESFEDYYIRKELLSLSKKTESLLQKIVEVPGKVAFQVSDPTKDGFLMADNRPASTLLFDNSISTGHTIEDNGFLQVDLGDNRKSRFIRFNFRNWELPDSIIVKGSLDGISFNDISAFPSFKMIHREPTDLYSSYLIDAKKSYRFYRFVFLSSEGNHDSSISEFEVESLEPVVKEDYFYSLSIDEIYDIQRDILLISELCYVECQDNVLLQSLLSSIWDKYNKLAVIFNEPSIEPISVHVASAPTWVIPIENTRFNVEVAATGSMATGLMAEAGLGKVTLAWETDEEDFADLLGYNIYRYHEVGDSTYTKYDSNGNNVGYHWEHFTRMDTIIANPSVLDSEETEFVDYDVVPGTTYYYVIKQLTTSLTSHALSNAVAATPLTAQKGDANGSMSVDIADVVTEVAYITYQDPQPFIFEAADVNSDQKVNVLDVVGTLGIIINPEDIGVSGMDDEPVRYYVQDGVLYVENTQPLGGVQVRLNVAKGTEITALEALTGMEQTSVWVSDDEYLFLAYSMSGQTIPAGTHALLKIGEEAVVTEMIASDSKGHNITTVNNNTTGIGRVEAMQLQMPTPNPFTTVLNVPYTIGKSGSHEVTIAFSDMAGRTIDAYHTVNTQGEYLYTWYPRALQKGLYLVSLYVDGELMQTVKVIKN